MRPEVVKEAGVPLPSTVSFRGDSEVLKNVRATQWKEPVTQNNHLEAAWHSCRLSGQKNKLLLVIDFLFLSSPKNTTF